MDSPLLFQSSRRFYAQSYRAVAGQLGDMKDSVENERIGLDESVPINSLSISLILDAIVGQDQRAGRKRLSEGARDAKE